MTAIPLIIVFLCGAFWPMDDRPMRKLALALVMGLALVALVIDHG
jgi:hypothetical protein